MSVQGLESWISRFSPECAHQYTITDPAAGIIGNWSYVQIPRPAHYCLIVNIQQLRFKPHSCPHIFNLPYNTQLLKLVFLGNTEYTEERGRVVLTIQTQLYTIYSLNIALSNQTIICQCRDSNPGPLGIAPNVLPTAPQLTHSLA